MFQNCFYCFRNVKVQELFRYSINIFRMFNIQKQADLAISVYFDTDQTKLIISLLIISEIKIVGFKLPNPPLSFVGIQFITKSQTMFRWLQFYLILCEIIHKVLNDCFQLSFDPFKLCLKFDRIRLRIENIPMG